MKKLQLVLILFISFPLIAIGQENQLDTLVNRFAQYREHSLQEKLYAHLDRQFYLTGETLWFKVYAVDGSFHKPIDVSKVAYAEVLDRANFPVLQAKIELKDGVGSGSFYLPASLGSGNYKFRIYTSWMKNFSAEFYFDEMVTIVNPFVVPETTRTKSSASCKVDFFPEGGNLVSGIKSKVAFKISDPSGKGCSCKGFILNEREDTISTFIPSRFGIGYFMFTPSGEEKYKVILADQPTVFPFPEVQRSGFVMQLIDSGEFLGIAVTSKETQSSGVYLFVHARQIIAYVGKQLLNNNRAVFMVKKNLLSEGISHFTVFNNDLQPLCERIYFTYPRKKLDIVIAANQKVFNPRKKVVISIDTKSESGKPAAANLSMSVFRNDSLSKETTAGIYPYLWLTSDLKGEIESPEYYFERVERGVSADMDNLMLTHGWRRFDWNEVIKKEAVVRFLPEVRGHIITAMIMKDKVKQRGVFSYLGSPGKIVRAYGSWSNAEGEARFEIKDFYGPRRIIIQTRTDSTQVYEVEIQNPFSPVMDNDKLPEPEVQAGNARDLLLRSVAMQVQDIYYYEQQANNFVRPTVDSSAFYGKADDTYMLDDYTRFPVMEEVMREYVPGVFVRKRRDGFHFIVIDKVNGGVLPGDPMVLLDGVPVFDVDDVMKVNPLQVRKLEVVNRYYYLGQAVFSGIVSYTTYQGDLGDLQLRPGSVSLDYEGLQLKRKFFSPQYLRDTNDRLPDQRYLLHWQPEVATDENGKQKVEFYTSDVPGNYRVVVEGLSANGFSGSKTFTFSVQTSGNP